jgi:hypothetical protein
LSVGVVVVVVAQKHQARLVLVVAVVDMSVKL